MKRVVTLFVIVFLTGCVAPAVNQSLHMSQGTQAVEHSYAVCKSTVDATPEAMRLSKYFVLGKSKNDSYLEKIAIESYVTDAQITDLYTYRDNLKFCRDKAVNDLKTFNMDYGLLVSDYFDKDDKITADAVNKRITIGEANRKITQSEYSFSVKEFDLKNNHIR